MFYAIRNTLIGNGREKVSTIFSPGPMGRISQLKEPLDIAGSGLRDVNPETLISTYFDTLIYGVSKPEIR
jgi:hypothetical protein